MGSGVSDLSGVSPAVLHEVVLREYRLARAEKEEALASGAAPRKRRAALEDAFDELAREVVAYEAQFKLDRTRREALLELASKVHSKYEQYKQLQGSHLFQVGDVVKVRDPSIPTLFVEAVVLGIDGENLEVKLTDKAAGEHKGDGEGGAPEEPDEDDSFVVSVESDSIRKLRSWSSLEVGDRVRVRDQGVTVTGTIVALDDEAGTATVDVSSGSKNEHDEFADAYEKEENADDLVTLPQSECVKVDTRRFAVLRLSNSVHVVRSSIVVAKAFKMGLASPKSAASPKHDAAVDAAAVGAAAAGSPGVPFGEIATGSFKQAKQGPPSKAASPASALTASMKAKAAKETAAKSPSSPHQQSPAGPGPASAKLELASPTAASPATGKASPKISSAPAAASSPKVSPATAAASPKPAAAVAAAASPASPVASPSASKSPAKHKL
jgi:hypothetical protein